MVAPRVGAWIETIYLRKLNFGIVSHPVWVRGLKPSSALPSFQTSEVAPRVGAWIETCSRCAVNDHDKSHPVWVRGLKLN